MIRFENVEKAFGGHQVLRGVSFTIQPGDVHFLMGCSGAGKSVLIKHLVGLLRPDAGRIWLEHQELTGLRERGFHEVRKRCQMIFQHATLFESMSVLENVADCQIASAGHTGEISIGHTESVGHSDVFTFYDFTIIFSF